MTTTDGTPGLYYAFAYALYSALVMLLLNKDRKWKKEIPGTILMTFPYLLDHYRNGWLSDYQPGLVCAHQWIYCSGAFLLFEICM